MFKVIYAMMFNYCTISASKKEKEELKFSRTRDD